MRKILFISLRNVKRHKTPPLHNIILFELDFSVKFLLLHLLPFVTDLKSTILNFIICQKFPDVLLYKPATNTGAYSVFEN